MIYLPPNQIELGLIVSINVRIFVSLQVQRWKERREKRRKQFTRHQSPLATQQSKEISYRQTDECTNAKKKGNERREKGMNIKERQNEYFEV